MWAQTTIRFCVLWCCYWETGGSAFKQSPRGVRGSNIYAAHQQQLHQERAGGTVNSPGPSPLTSSTARLGYITEPPIQPRELFGLPQDLLQSPFTFTNRSGRLYSCWNEELTHMASVSRGTDTSGQATPSLHLEDQVRSRM
ncbi:hypothetical protein NDU88_006306 [Pleurodeles waltl]|uniref:Uncharacterized protein n=1 Tax=Pleurodeles waltl TaxID=8319 RepID=A0AAV7RP59_PLEWA|nr:hypothetical protein NDU88_006306 [Pleurodeles waltl]